MRNKILVTGVVVGIIAQIATLAWMLIQRELTLHCGTVCLLETAPVDPFDAFRGRYVSLAFNDLGSAIVPEERGKWQRGTSVWLSLQTNDSGVARIGTVCRARPDGLSIKTAVSYSNDEYKAIESVVTNRYGHAETRRTGNTILRFNDLPCNRFYMPERLAPQAEQAYLAANRRSGAGSVPRQNAHAKVRAWRGHVVIEDLLISGIPIREFIERRTQPKTFENTSE